MRSNITDLHCPVLDDILRASKLTIIHDLSFSTVIGTVPIHNAFLSSPTVQDFLLGNNLALSAGTGLSTSRRI